MKLLDLPPELVSGIIAQAVRISTLIRGFELRRISRKFISPLGSSDSLWN